MPIWAVVLLTAFRPSLAGKQEYEFGDVSKAAAKKVGGAIAVGSSKVGEAIKVGVSGFTGACA